MRRAAHGFARIGLLTILLALAAPCVSRGQEQGYFNPDLLVETAWLEENLNHPALRVLDFGRESYEYDEGHIPGAVFVDAEWVSAEIDGVPGMLAPVGRVVEALAETGVGDGSTVVVYDAGNCLWASRLLWALEFLGHRDVRLLNGGWKRWVAEERDVSSKPPVVLRGHLTPRVDLSWLATKASILAGLSRADVTILDVRSPAEYTGEDARAMRGGHIPGAVNVDWISALTDGEIPTFLPADELRALFGAAGVTPDQEIITYCQGGVRAAHTYFALRLLGYPRVRNYDGSWVEWGNDSGVPVVVGASLE